MLISRITLATTLSVCASLAWSTTAVAAPPDDAAATPEGPAAGGSADASLSLGGEGPDADAAGGGGAEGPRERRYPPVKEDRMDQPWIKRWAPERNMWELGLYIGAYVPTPRHELYEWNPNLPDAGHQGLDTALDGGVRAAFFPLRMFGLELEGGGMPTSAENDESAMLYTVRGHLIAQLWQWSVSPFALLGGGMLGVSSDGTAVGNDIDAALHFGGGVKIYIFRWLVGRVDVRDVVTHRRGNDQFTGHNFEVLFGLSATLGREVDEPKRKKPAPAPARGPVDTDGDGITDDVDACVSDPETVNGFEDEDGCPETDTDGDGVYDSEDQCKDEPGDPPTGCPPSDTDGDGIMDDVDACVDEPETKNGFEDQDGCPDEVPDEVTKFTGNIKGIYFQTGKAEIKDKSKPKLDEAISILKKYPDLRLEVVGHTDNVGKRAYNVELSKQRADAVRDYLVSNGVDSSRLETRGAGPDEPVADNGTKTGRSKNRRIEFKVLR